jgi:hypothetical protein
MFYDFSSPMEVPLKLHTDEYCMNDAESVEFTEKGECILTVTNDEGNKEQIVIPSLK